MQQWRVAISVIENFLWLTLKKAEGVDVKLSRGKMRMTKKSSQAKSSASPYLMICLSLFFGMENFKKMRISLTTMRGLGARRMDR